METRFLFMYTESDRMADTLIIYEIVVASFVFLTALLFSIRRKYYKMRSARNNAVAKTNISWMKSGF